MNERGKCSVDLAEIIARHMDQQCKTCMDVKCGKDCDCERSNFLERETHGLSSRNSNRQG
jgi:hypothetical protein